MRYPHFPTGFTRRFLPSTLFALLGGLATLGLTGCQNLAAAPGTQLASPPKEVAAPLPDSGVRFREVAVQAGIAYQWHAPGKRPLNILQTIGNGCAFLDYNGDGNLDILLIGPHLALYKGDGKGHFVDVTHLAGLDKLTGQFLGCAVGDYDGDGWPDIYVSGYRTGLLLHNQVGKGFVDVTRTAGLKPQPWGTSAAWAETVPGSGRLDLFICNYADFGPNTQPQLCNFGDPAHPIPSSCGPRYYKPLPAVLYANLGNGKFADVSRTRGIAGLHGRGLGAAWADYDDSGLPGLAVANDEIDGDLLKATRTGNSVRYENVGNASGVAVDRDGNIHGGMGTDWGDYDNDGKLDLVVATFQREAKCLYHNDGTGLFTERSSPLGLAGPTAPWVAFGAKFADVDNDGFLDLWFANGHVQDNIADVEKNAVYRQPTQLFHNGAGQRFDDISQTACAALQTPIVGRGLAVGDYDNDGRIDALVVDSEGRPLLLHNESKTPNHWLGVKLIGTKCNHDGIGAMLTLEANGQKFLRRCATDGSYLSASDVRVHFGLGATHGPLTLHIRWPDGTQQTVSHLTPDRYQTIREETFSRR